MPTKVLIIDNDARFASELATALGNVGAETSVVEDPNQGLQLAVTERPQLIVLAVELHKTNGFSICQRLKRESSLASIPVVLTTTNATDVTIEQHRQRPNHADDYIRKPIDTEALLERLGAFISLGQAPSSDDEEVLIDDDLLEVEELRPSVRPKVSVIPADSDVANFTDAAFEGLMTDEAPRSAAPAQMPSSPPPSEPSSVRPSQVPSPERSSASMVPGSSESSKVRIRVLEDQLEEAHAKILDLESRDLSAKEAEIEQLRRELDDAKGKLLVAGRTGGSSSAREVLDLREQLHKKEKELLDLRDKVTQKEKEVFGLKDASLDFERQRADLTDKLDEIARQLTEAQRHIDAARADKEAANRRTDDAKRRVDKLTQQLEEKAVELDEQRSAFDTAQQQFAAERAQLAEDLRATEQRGTDELRDAMARASAEINLQAEKAQKHLEDSLANQERAHAQALEQALEEASRAADARVADELSQARARADNDQAQALDELQGRLRADNESAQTRQREEHARELQALRDEHTRSTQEARGAHLVELEQLRQAHDAALQTAQNDKDAALQAARADTDAALQKAQAEREQSEQLRDEKIRSLEGRLDALRRELSDANARANEFERLTARARENAANSKLDIDKIKDALASTLVHLESIEGRAID